MAFMKVLPVNGFLFFGFEFAMFIFILRFSYGCY